MMTEEKTFELIAYECEQCKNKKLKKFGCLKCGLVVCTNCIDGYISDWECICKECGWQ